MIEIVSLSFPTSPEAAVSTAGGLKLRRVEIQAAMSELFVVTVDVLCTNPALPESAFVGHEVAVHLPLEPVVTEMRGIVAAMGQDTAVPDGDSRYRWTIVPPHWLATQRLNHRIFQDMTVPEIVAAVLADPCYEGRIPAPTLSLHGTSRKRDYCVQYAETDWTFLSRILAEEGIATFFDHANGGTFTLTDDTTCVADSPCSPIPFFDPSHPGRSVPVTPHMQTVRVVAQVRPAAVVVRDYDFRKPDYRLEGRDHAPDVAAFKAEGPLEAYAFAVGDFVSEAGGRALARRRLDAVRSDRRRVIGTSNFTLLPGAGVVLAEHPREDVNGAYVVVRTRTLLDVDGQRLHEVELLDLLMPFRPSTLPKPRIHGTQTAFVVGADGQEIDVDEHGRVLIAFRWDRRDPEAGVSSRRVRVAQAWAGAGFGLVTLPRVGTEVVVAFLDGDPDEPLVVGQVHNVKAPSPLSLPTDATRSVWKSQTSPGGDGHNSILMEDLAGRELLALTAQRDHRLHVGNDSAVHVGHDATTVVEGDHDVTVKGEHRGAVHGGSAARIGGDYSIRAKKVTIEGTEVVLDAEGLASLSGENTTVYSAGAHLNLLRSRAELHGGDVTVSAETSITLKVGGSTLIITDASITLNSPKIDLNP